MTTRTGGQEPAPATSSADADSVGAPEAPGRGGRGFVRDRQHRFPGRKNALKVLYDDIEVAAVRSAAEAAGLTATGFVAAAAADPHDPARRPGRGRRATARDRAASRACRGCSTGRRAAPQPGHPDGRACGPISPGPRHGERTRDGARQRRARLAGTAKTADVEHRQTGREALTPHLPAGTASVRLRR
jgi:hypothetical protein